MFAHSQVLNESIKVKPFGQWVIITIFMDLQTSLLAEEGVVSCQVQVEGTLTRGGVGVGWGRGSNARPSLHTHPR